MQEINFFSVKGSNVNRIFNLGLSDNMYYSWDEIKEKVKDNEQFKTIVENFDLVIVGRRSRLERLKKRLEERGIAFIPHSYLVRNYVMYGRKSCEEVVKTLYMMKVLFEKCNIRQKWEKYKMDNGQQIYSYDEKDQFYETEYNKYVDVNPSMKY